MLGIAKKVACNTRWLRLLIILAIARAVLDIAENSILMYVCSMYPSLNNTLVEICSWITTCKFIALLSWILGAVGIALSAVANRIERNMAE
jgi:hypothetical protein